MSPVIEINPIEIIYLYSLKILFGIKSVKAETKIHKQRVQIIVNDIKMVFLMI